MNTSIVRYKGGLRTEATHVKSGNEIITDAPLDNNGKGNAFSPTDLLATSLASCVLTVMGIKARSMDFDLEEASAEIVKTMASNPRRVSQIDVDITLRNNCDEKTQTLLEKVGLNCPVAKSISPEIKQNIRFIWK